MAGTSTLQDTFQTNVLSGIWDTSNSSDPTQVVCQNDRLEISHSATASYNACQATSTYNLTGDSFYARILDRGNQTLASHEVILGTYLDGSNKMWFTCNINNLSAYKVVAGVQAQIGASITYSATQHRFLRFRESGGTMFWETSSDGAVGNWVTQWSTSNPFAITAIKPFLQSGCYNTETVGSYGYFDQFNFGRVNAVPTRPYVSVGSSMSRSDT